MFHISPNVLVYILALPDNLYRLLWINSEKRPPPTSIDEFLSKAL